MASHCKRSYKEKEEKGELFQVDKTFSSSCQIPFPLGPLCVHQSKYFDAVKRMLLYIKHTAMVMVGLIDMVVRCSKVSFGFFVLGDHKAICLYKIKLQA